MCDGDEFWFGRGNGRSERERASGAEGNAGAGSEWESHDAQSHGLVEASCAWSKGQW